MAYGEVGRADSGQPILVSVNEIIKFVTVLKNNEKYLNYFRQMLNNFQQRNDTIQCVFQKKKQQLGSGLEKRSEGCQGICGSRSHYMF